jgi:hypothetical protein
MRGKAHAGSQAGGRAEVIASDERDEPAVASRMVPISLWPRKGLLSVIAAVMLVWPPATRADLDPSPRELARKSPRVDAEPDCDHLEQIAHLILSRGVPNALVGQLANYPSTRDAEPIEVTNHGGAVDREAPSQSIDRRAAYVLPCEVFDIGVRQAALDRV